jgi:hypothetical protein
VAHHFSPNGLTSISKVQAERGWRASRTALAAMSSAFRKKSSGLSGMFWRVRRTDEDDVAAAGGLHLILLSAIRPSGHPAFSGIAS